MKNNNSKNTIDTFYKLFVEENESKEIDSKEEIFLEKAFNILYAWKRENMFKEGSEFQNSFQNFSNFITTHLNSLNDHNQIRSKLVELLGSNYSISPTLCRKLEENTDELNNEAERDLLLLKLWEKHISEKG